MGASLPEVHTWAEWGQIFTDVELWRPIVREICRQEALDFEQIEAGLPGSNAVFVLDRGQGANGGPGRQYVVKIYAPFCREDYDLECDLYPLLERYAQIPAPRLWARGVWRDRIDWPYIVMEYVPGQPIGQVRAEIAPDNRVEIAAQLGGIVRELHDVPLDWVRALDTTREGWERFVLARKARIARELAEQTTLSPPVIGACVALLDSWWERGLGGPLALLNGDVTADHVLVARRDGKWHISGLIDFADALVGPVEYEWVALWFDALNCEPDSMRAFTARYAPQRPLDTRFIERMMAFTLLHEFGAGIIRTTLERLNHPPIRSHQELARLLWGNLLQERECF